MRKILAFLLIALFSAFIKVQVASAHVLKTDGNISAIMHIDPDDDPVANSVASFFFEFEDKSGKFTPKECNCVFSIAENGKQIYSQDLFQNNSSPNLGSPSVFYSFPEKNVYQVKVVGNPIAPSGFQPFTLVYVVRVAKDANQQKPASSFNPILVSVPIFVAALILFFLFKNANFKRGIDD